jgi:hypothetical protein
VFAVLPLLGQLLTAFGPASLAYLQHARPYIWQSSCLWGQRVHRRREFKPLQSRFHTQSLQWVVRILLEHGFSVRGAVRSADKGAHLTELFASYGDKFELIVVPNITQVSTCTIRSPRFLADLS